MVVAGVEQQGGVGGDAVREQPLAVALVAFAQVEVCEVAGERDAFVAVSDQVRDRFADAAAVVGEHHRGAGVARVLGHHDDRQPGPVRGRGVVGADRPGEHDQPGHVIPGERTVELREPAAVGAVRAGVQRLHRHDPVTAGHRGGVDALDDRPVVVPADKRGQNSEGTATHRPMIPSTLRPWPVPPRQAHPYGNVNCPGRPLRPADESGRSHPPRHRRNP